MTHTLDVIKGSLAGIFGFAIQLTSLDTLVKVGVGILTVFYLSLKCAEIVRDWKCKSGEGCATCKKFPHHKTTTKE
jgi:hypothetical protein